MRVELPWPPSALRPNAASPGNWRRKANAAKQYRSDCSILCRASLTRADVTAAHLTIRFCPPDRRRRDLDNMLGQIKQGLDAISEAIGVDDSRFGLTLVRGEPVKGGAVIVDIAGDDFQPFGRVAARVVEGIAQRMESEGC